MNTLPYITKVVPLSNISAATHIKTLTFTKDRICDLDLIIEAPCLSLQFHLGIKNEHTIRDIILVCINYLNNLSDIMYREFITALSTVDESLYSISKRIENKKPQQLKPETFVTQYKFSNQVHSENSVKIIYNIIY